MDEAFDEEALLNISLRGQAHEKFSDPAYNGRYHLAE